MGGFSITLLLLPTSSDSSAPAHSKILSLLDASADVPGWKWSAASPPPSLFENSETTLLTPSTNTPMTKYPRLSVPNPSNFVQTITKACQALRHAEPEITRMDSIAGDGDCGLTLKAGAEGLNNQYFLI